ncbi:MAG: tyrosine-type recombinase/integrase [Microcella pacifica]
MLTDYIRHLHDLHRAPTTIRLRTHYVRQYVTRYDPTRATPESLSRWVHSHEWKPATVQSAAASLRSFFHWAHRTGMLPTNPAADLIPPKSRRNKARVATDGQIAAALLKAATPQQEAWIRLGAECGLRVHEIAKVHQDDIDGEWLHVVGKGAQYRQQWLSARLRDVLERCLPESRHGWLFPGKSGKPVHTSTIWRAMRDLGGFNPHALRHRAGRVVYKSGGNNIRLAQEFLGHSSPMTTAHYLGIEQDELQEAGQYAAFDAA